MNYPDFYNKIQTITLYDELSEFLGSTEGGMVEISYLDIVKMAGHSCATVGGAYLMAVHALKALYQNEIPKRGNIKVELREKLEDGNTGVVAQVFSNITGATTNNGFGGLNGNFNRRNLLFYGADIKSTVRFTRLDTNKSVEIEYSPMKVVIPGEIMQSALAPDASEESKKSFPIRWQEMVKTIFENADKVIEIS